MGKLWLGFSIAGLIAGLYGVFNNFGLMNSNFFISLLFLVFCLGEILRELGYIREL